MSTTPKNCEALVSYVVVTRNTRELTLGCLASIRANGLEPGRDIVLVDNASSDGTAEAARREFPEAAVLDNGENAGFGRACNQGADACRGRYLFFLNSDTKLTPGCTDTLLSTMASDSRIGAAGPRLVGKDGSVQISAAILMEPASDLFSALRRSRTRRLQERLDRSGDITGLGYLSGAALMVRRDAFDQAAGFAEELFFYHEDADLCKRIARNGWGVRYVSDAEVCHCGGSSTDSVRMAAAIEMMRSRLQYLRKHYGWSGAIAGGCGHLAGNARRAVVGAVASPLSPGRRARTKVRWLTCAWFVLGMPSRQSATYRRLFGDWDA